MVITVVIDDATGALEVRVDRDGVPAPLLSWMLRKAESAIFNPPAAPPKVIAAPAGALRQIPGLNGHSPG
jgi:hypothetical protein